MGNKLFLSYLLLVLFITLSVLILCNSILSIQELTRAQYAASVDMIDERMNSLFYEINNFPRYAGNDILFLSRLIDSKQNIKDLERDLLTFLKENPVYDQLAYLDTDGQILATVARGDRKPYIQPAADWFNKTLALGSGEVFVSRLSLEQEDSKSTPIIKYGTPVFADNGLKQGLIISHVNAGYFLEDIRRSQREGEEVFLIDNNGQYLAHPDQRKEFAGSFANDYPEFFRELQANTGQRIIETTDKILSFKYIYPTRGSFAIFKASQKTDDSYYWIMVSITGKEEILKGLNDLKSRHYIFLTVSLVTLASIFSLGLVYKIKK